MAKMDPGHVLTADEVADMVAYDQAGVRRPEQYANVVFDVTDAKGAVYRVKTKEEAAADDDAYAAANDAAKAQADRVAKVQEAHRKEMAKAASGGRVMVDDAGAGAGSGGNVGAVTDAPHTGEKASTGTRRG